MTELDEYTMGIFKKAAILKSVSKFSRILVLICLPLLILNLNKSTNSNLTVYSVLFLLSCAIFIVSQRKLNYVNAQIGMNLWLSDMVKNPQEFEKYVEKKDIK